jgi:hypothetical protein
MVVTGEESPYKKMISKTKDIDIDYFEKIDRGFNSISDELSPELKDVIVDKFIKMADCYYAEGDLESKIIAMIQKEADIIKEEKSVNECKNFLNNLAESLESYVKGTFIHPGFPKYSNEDVAVMYQEAKHITLTEFFMGNNSEDILGFYSALMDNTWWACREVVVNKTNDFLLKIAMKTRDVETLR